MPTSSQELQSFQQYATARLQNGGALLELDHLFDEWRNLNPDSKRTVSAYLEPSLKSAQAEDRFQFERHGYFVADRVDSKQGQPMFNRAVTLKDPWTTRK